MNGITENCLAAFRQPPRVQGTALMRARFRGRYLARPGSWNAMNSSASGRTSTSAAVSTQQTGFTAGQTDRHDRAEEYP